MSNDEIIAWLSEQTGIALINDDRGYWAVSGTGMQNLPDEVPGDITTTFFVMKHEWKPTIREAVEAYVQPPVPAALHPSRESKAGKEGA